MSREVLSPSSPKERCIEKDLPVVAWRELVCYVLGAQVTAHPGIFSGFRSERHSESDVEQGNPMGDFLERAIAVMQSDDQFDAGNFMEILELACEQAQIDLLSAGIEDAMTMPSRLAEAIQNPDNRLRLSPYFGQVALAA